MYFSVTKRSFVESNLSIRSLNKSITLTEKNIEKRNSKGKWIQFLKTHFMNNILIFFSICLR